MHILRALAWQTYAWLGQGTRLFAPGETEAKIEFTSPLWHDYDDFSEMKPQPRTNCKMRACRWDGVGARRWPWHLPSLELGKVLLLSWPDSLDDYLATGRRATP